MFRIQGRVSIGQLFNIDPIADMANNILSSGIASVVSLLRNDITN